MSAQVVTCSCDRCGTGLISRSVENCPACGLPIAELTAEREVRDITGGNDP